MRKNPLLGRRILMTRAREQSAESTLLFEKLGAEVIVFPTIEIVPPLRWDALDQAVDRLRTYDWIIFTSANGVHFFWQRLKKRKRRLPPSLKVCAIGPATAKALKGKGVPVHYVPKKYIAEAVLQGFEEVDLRGKRILLARARIARDVLPKGLRKMGAKLDVVETYRTVKPRAGGRKLRRLLAEEKIDVITFTSSSTVNHFVDLLKKENIKTALKGVSIACIGPVTARTAKARGLKVVVQPDQYTIPGLAQAIAKYFIPLKPRRTRF